MRSKQQHTAPQDAVLQDDGTDRVPHRYEQTERRDASKFERVENRNRRCHRRRRQVAVVSSHTQV